MVPDDVPFEFIREITDDFSGERILGEGAFGVVYKGVTKDGHDVAVKKLKHCFADLENKKFRNEFDTLRMLKHQNIVKFLGYCYETKKKPFKMPDGSKAFVDEINTALCFEYLHNGSLQEHLSDECCQLKLDWHMRFKIIKGICEGLKYMHKDLEKPIYHFNLKPDNILLDKDMVPKIADFGLSRIFGQDIAQTTHNPYGTLGYRPPECIYGGEISGEFDIFSLGTVMIRIVSGSLGYSECSDSMSSDEFIDQVRENWRKKLQETFCSDLLLEAYCCQVETCTQIALNCLDEDSQKRPDIVKITEKLKEIEVGIGKLPDEGCGMSKMTVQNHNIEMTMKSKDITVQHQNADLLSISSPTKQKLIDARERSTGVVELIVGRAQEKENIISVLESSSEKIFILPIYGTGGIGKTTFSRLIYNDPKFKFYSKAWVHVSQRFDLNKILESILSQLSERENQGNERKVVSSSLTELLTGKNIMIVLDDLWEDNQFQLMNLKDMLYHDDSKIIILVTTRSECIAERICTNIKPYKILPLTNDMCWDIIKERSGLEARDDKEKLVGIGREIARKCGGVPLAAQSLGFTLRSKTFDKWMEVKDNDMWNEHISNDISLRNHVLTPLMLSYSYMDQCLKSCFTYCAIFPKGLRIVKNDLIYQWISLGFIKPTGLLSVMDICEKYIMQLKGLSFLQESPKSYGVDHYLVPQCFTMHDLVHDLALSMLHTGRSSCCYALLNDCSRPLELSCTSAATLVALLFRDCWRTELHSHAFESAKSLRVLDLSECFIWKLPDSIGDLKQLRYLNAPGIKDRMIPSITKLSKLNYLNLHGAYLVPELVESIGEMDSLMYLDLSSCSEIERVPEFLGKLKRLLHLNLANCTISALPESIGEMDRLMHLDLSGCARIERLPQSLGKLTKLVHLNLANCYSVQGESGLLSNLTELQFLNLSNCTKIHTSDDVQLLQRGLHGILGNFTNLRYLNLSGCFVGLGEHEMFWLLDCMDTLYSLEHLDLSDNTSLTSLPECIGNLKSIHTLVLSNCTIISALPESIGEMDCLLHLDLSGCARIERLPQSLGKLKRLVHLNLANCYSVQGVSELLSNLTELEFLNLSHCTKSHTSDDAQLLQRGLHGILGNLTNLRYLNLSGCFIGLDEHQMSRLVACMHTLYNMEHLDLSDNTSLTSLPESITNLKKVHTLDLSNCIKLSKLPTVLGKMYNLKFLILENCLSLGFSDVSQFSYNKVVLPKFLVKSRDGLSSNLVLLCGANNIDGLNISQLENVTSTEEALKIKLMGKHKFTELSFDWTQDAKRCVKDAKVLEYLVPPNTLRKLNVGGYSGEIFPYWFMGIGYYLRNLISIKMVDMPKCVSLPPLGQLPNLKELVIRGMDRITYIDESFYGGPRAFPQLRKFELGRMGDLQVWKTVYSFEDTLEELMSPNLEHLTIDDCPMLRLIPCPPRALNWKIDKSDNVLSSLREGTSLDILEHLTVLKSLSLSRCETTTLPHWLVQLNLLQDLEIRDCPKLNNLQILQHLISLQALALRNCGDISVLPDCLGNLVALKEFVIQNCRGIKYLPECIGRLTKLEELEIIECPDLDQWCRLDEKMMKLISHTETKKKKDHYTSEDQSTDSRMQNTASQPLYLKLQNFLIQKKKDHYTSEDQSTNSKIQNITSEPLYLTYTQLQKITNGFSRKVGEGAHGEVYRGSLENGEEIAVKMLRSDMTQLEDNLFLNELENLIRLEHRNILRLVGYCDEKRYIYADFDGTRVLAEQRYRALCLEYLQNGSLRKHLCDECNGLDWHTRYKIIKGTCEGLKYLREGIEKPVYHLDLKPDNILLDKNMEPKLADFGLSRMFRGDLTCITQSSVGTTGYLPPEYIDHKKISHKLDIYSLGVVMIETIAGPEGRSKSYDMSPKEFIDHVCGNWRKRLQETCDGSLRKIEVYCEQVKRCTQLSLDCIEKDRNNRPSIVDVIDRLNKVEYLLNI